MVIKINKNEKASNARFKQEVAVLLIRRGLASKDLYSCVGTKGSHATYYGKMKDPNNFTLGELRRLARRLGVTVLDLLQGEAEM